MMKQKQSPYELMHQIARREAWIKKYEAAGMPKLARRYRLQVESLQALLNLSK